MKKLFKSISSVTLGTAMVFSLAGCGGTGSQPAASGAETTAKAAESDSSGTSEAPAADSSAAGDSAAGALSGITLKVGTSGLFAPFSYYDTDGKTLIGYDLDFLNELKDLLGFEIDTGVQAMDYSALTTSLAEGKLDIGMAALCATDERKQVMNFSETYYDSGQILCVNGEVSPAELKSVEDLKSGKYVVAVEKGTASHLYCMNNGIPESALQVHDTITTAYESLEQGKVDCLIQDTPGMAYYIQTTPETKLKMLGDEFNQGQAPYAIGVSFDLSENNPEIIDILNQGIEELTANGTMDKLRAKWCE
ncbi:transporter substrate-binding domain-containing protein [Lachnospiraceae bacterium 54-53]